MIGDLGLSVLCDVFFGAVVFVCMCVFGCLYIFSSIVCFCCIAASWQLKTTGIYFELLRKKRLVKKCLIHSTRIKRRDYIGVTPSISWRNLMLFESWRWCLMDAFYYSFLWMMLMVYDMFDTKVDSMYFVFMSHIAVSSLIQISLNYN